jgi:aminoglycoside phosphotransferase (APT) family kinase protein
MPGDVARPPYAEWVMTTDALASVGKLLRRLHEAAAAVPVDRSVPWPQELADPAADPAGKTLLCHNDVSLNNVVFQDGLAVALIDFDMAAPGRPLWDVAIAARYWALLLAPASAPTRLRVLADSYGLGPQERAALPATIEQVTEVCRAFVAARVAAGDPTYVERLAARGGWERWDRLQSWMTTRRDVFTSALLS